MEQAAHARRIPWIALGDWNLTPDELWLCTAGNAIPCAVCNNDGDYIPSRWEGRCVDYAIASRCGELHFPSYWTEKLSDHKIFQVTVEGDLRNADNWYIAPTRSYIKPDNVSVNQWRSTIEQLWLDTLPIPVTSTEEEWYIFNTSVEEALQQAAAVHGSKFTQKKRPKGTAPWIVSANHYDVRSHSMGSFEFRSTAKMLGRIKEYRRQIGLGQEDRKLLANINRRWPTDLPWQGWSQAENQLENKLSNLRSTLKQQHMSQWRARMNAQGKAATRWLKAKPALTPVSILRPDGSKTMSSSEALAAISEFWRPIWDRHITEEVGNSVKNELSQPAEDGPQLEDPFPSPQNLLRTARTTNHGAAGPDGWSGDEVVHWSLDMWQCYHELLNRWAKRGVWPRSWQHIRQVHIRKKEDIYEGEAVPPKDMRPISVQSILVRIVGSAFTSQKEVRDWALSKVPACCHGSLASRDVATAWAVLNEAIEHKKIIASMDFEKCFDHVWPKLALAILQRKGLSPVWCDILSHIWEGQRRWLQLGRDTATTPAHVSGSLPQGDALSPLALILLLADDATDIANRSQVTMSMYVDDRAVCSNSASSVIQAVRAWNHASTRLGLKENEGKTCFVCFSPQQRNDLIAQGVNPHNVQGEARILGVDVMTHSNEVPQTMMRRCQQGLGILARLAFCPIGREVRRSLYRSRVIPLLAWGVWMRSLPQDVVKETRRLYRCLSRGHPMGSKSLRTILEGHRTDPQFWALQQSVEAAVRANNYRELGWHLGGG